MSKRIKDTDYLHLSTRIRAMENALLERERMDRMLEAGTVECPNCKGKFVIDVGDCEDDECGCGCGCDHDHDHGDEE